MPKKVKEPEPELLEPWERLPVESSPAWEAFVLYRDGGPARTIRGVCRQLHKSLTLIGRWSVRHKWVERAGGWDAYTDRIRREASLKAVKEMTERHARMAATALGVISEMQATFIKRVVQQKLVKGPDGNPLPPFQSISDKDLAGIVLQSARSLDSLTKVERTARGLPETWIMISEMDDQQLEAFVLALLSERERTGVGLGPGGDEEAGDETSPADQGQDAT